MSQAKVDKYKQEKANRKKIMKKEKRQHVLRVLLGCLVGLALVGFLVWTVVDKYNEKNNETQQITLSEEEMSKLIEQLNSTTTGSEKDTSKNDSTEKNSEKESTEKTSDDEASEKETPAKEEDTTEAAK